MDSMFDLLFGRISGGLDAGIMALSLLGSLALCAALFLLGRRNEIAWWLVAGAYVLWGLSSLLGFSPRALDSVLSLLLFLLGVAIPLILGIGAGIYGLLLFQRFPRQAPMTRAVTLRTFKGTELVLPLAVALVFGLASSLPVLSVFAEYGLWDQVPLPSLATIIVTGTLGGLLPGGLVGLAQRGRWAWFLLVIPPLLDIYSSVITAGGSVKIFLSIATIALAVLGWARWGAVPAETEAAKYK
ncbi:hypothetical protein [Arthrobacter alpinus]|nr:hypothetical protein [Arthrobacter alpinus]